MYVLAGFKHLLIDRDRASDRTWFGRVREPVSS